MSLHPLDALPAVRRLDTDREDLFACEIEGRVGSADFENLCGLLEGAYALHEHIDLLLRFVDPERADWNEMDDASIEEAREHAAAHIRRCAAIGPSSVVTPFTDMFCSGAECRGAAFQGRGRSRGLELARGHREAVRRVRRRLPT